MQTEPETVFDRALLRTRDLYFWNSKAEIDIWPAKKILGLASACATRFNEAGVRAGNRVAICLPTSPELIACLIASWGCGATFILLPYIAQGNTDRSKSSKLGKILHLIKPDLLVHDEHMPYSSDALSLQRLTKHEIEEDIASLVSNAATNVAFPAKPELQDSALIQLTSGSTGVPKGVVITHRQLAINCAGIVDRALMNEGDHSVSWLPFNHDMGLTAITLPICANAAVTLIAPERFARTPMTWLEAMSTQRGTMTPSPAFAYTLLSRYAARFKPGELDLSCWRYGWVGAEPVFDKHLRAFTEAMRPFGLRETVLKPAFGMAEAVVAVTCNSPDRPYLAVHIDAALFMTTGKVKVLPPVTDSTQRLLSFVSNGPALDNMAVKIVNELGVDLGEAVQGHVWISGASVATAYLDGVDSGSFYDGGWFDTGDLGFLVDGELYISGRVKDLIIRGGVNASPQHVEWAIEQFLELRPGQVAAFSVIDTAGAKEEVIAIVGKRVAGNAAEAMMAQVAKVAAEQAGVQIDRVVFTASGKLPKTTSGKVQRAVARQMYLNRDFDETELEA